MIHFSSQFWPSMLSLFFHEVIVIMRFLITKPSSFKSNLTSWKSVFCCRLNIWSLLHSYLPRGIVMASQKMPVHQCSQLKVWPPKQKSHFHGGLSCSYQYCFKSSFKFLDCVPTADFWNVSFIPWSYFNNLCIVVILKGAYFVNCASFRWCV